MMHKPSRGALPFKSHGQGVQSNFSVEGVAHGPANDLPGIGVQDRGEVEPPLSGRNIGEIGEPDLVWGLSCKVAGEPVWSDRIVVTAVRGPGAAR